MKLLRFAIVAGLVFGLELAEPQPLIGQIRGQSRFSQDPLLLVPGKYRNAILFDDYLAPQGNFTALPERANDVLIAHRIAQQQINLAIAYLKSNRLQILAGSDPFWNEVYGKITKMTQVAILSTNPISGWGEIDEDDWIIEQVDTDDGPPSPPSPPHVAFRSHLKKGDWLFIAEQLPDGTLDEGYVRRVYDITWDDEYDDQEIELDANGDPVPINLDDALIADFRRVAKANGRSLEAELREALAQALAQEWADQGETIDPSRFVARDMADHAIDTIAPDPAATVEKLLAYAETDTLCYRADPDEAFWHRQQAVWEPLVVALEQREGVRLVDVVRGIAAAGDPPQLSGLKNQLRKRVPDFSEKRYGFGSFLSFAKAARARDLIAMEWSDDTGDYVLRPTS